jgi:hypothetical protein
MHFSPYGLMPAEWNSNNDLARPPRFRNPDGTPASDAQWLDWVESMADELAEFLWPRWHHGAWVGKADAHMKSLTEADLALMSTLAVRLDQTPQGVKIKHLELFLAEDPKPPNTAGFVQYLPQAPFDLLTHFDASLLAGGGPTTRPASLNLKRRMQRPRPYQAALQLLPKPASDFSYRAASSATSPSLVSGHCIQGSMALANVVVEHESLTGKPLPVNVLDALRRYFMDTGDRRVFAGVHYPSDNLSSWFVALRFCRHVFDTDQARTRARAVLWQGIQASDVFLALKQAVRGDAKSVFATPLRRLEAEAAA